MVDSVYFVKSTLPRAFSIYLQVCYKHIEDVHDTENSFDQRALTWYGKLTWKSAHAWNLIILR